MNENARRMRPMGITDILDETVELYKSSFVLLVGIAAVLNVPYSLFERYYYASKASHILSNPGAGMPTKDMAGFWGATAWGLLFVLLTAPIITGALTYAISERYLGRKVTILGSFKRVFSLSIFGKLFLAILVKALILVVPVVAAALAVGMAMVSAVMGHSTMIPLAFGLGAVGLAGGVAAAYVLLRLAVLEPTIVVEGKGFGSAFSRAWGFMHGNMVKCVSLLLLGWLVTSIVESVLSGPTQLVIMTKGAAVSPAFLILHAVIGAVASTILSPVMSIVTILLYYDIRIRREGFDLELLAKDLDAKTREISTYSAQPLPQEQTTEQAQPDSESSRQ